MEWLANYYCVEVHGTRQERFLTATTPPSATVKLKCLHTERYTVLRELLSTPAVYPFSNEVCPGDYDLYCTEAGLVPNYGAYTSDDSNVIDYLDYAFIDCTYTMLLGYFRDPGSLSNNEYIEEGLEPRMETLPINNNYYVWGTTTGSQSGSGAGEGDPLSTDESPVRYEPGVTYTRTIKGIRSFDIEWLNMQGTVHNQDFISSLLEMTFPADTLLLRSMTAVREWSHVSYSTCYPTWTVQLKYEYKPQTWNIFWRGGVQPPDYYYIKLKSDNTLFLPFDTADHSTFLFN